MKLNKVEIHGLFGHFNHSLEFKEENITIITAPNGYGKTICLKIIDAVFNHNLEFFRTLQFEVITFETSDGTLTLERSNENQITISHNAPDKESFILKEDSDPPRSKRSAFSYMIEREVPFLERVDPDIWMDERDGKLYSFDEVMIDFSKYLHPKVRRSFYSKFPEWYNEFSKAISSHFVVEQRLIQREITKGPWHSSEFENTIERYAKELSDEIDIFNAHSSITTQKLDSTFPKRLLDRKSPIEPMAKEELKRELQSLQNKRQNLLDFGLISSEEDNLQIDNSDDFLENIEEGDIKTLTLYAKDTQEKLAAHNEIYQKVKLFSNILNEGRLSFKKIKIKQKSGFYFESDIGEKLKLTDLSSGEQHQVVLLYELIFRVNEHDLVLIDEPEISLHIAWQKEFLADLQEIIRLQNISVVIATHSPQIVNGNWDFTIDLASGKEA